MRRLIPCSILLALSLAVPAVAATSVSIGVTLGNAPPPPVVVFRREPRLMMLPHTDLGYYDGPSDYDYFQYGSYFYIYNGGYWYRSRHYRGPFIAIRESYVPTIFYSLHDRGYHWRHGWRNAPRVQQRKMERREDRRGHDRGNDRDRGRGRGHGRGHGKGKG